MMLKNYLIIIGLLFANFVFSQNETDTLSMDWEAYDPPSTLVVPENKINRAKFPFIDVHSHHWRMDEMDLNDLI